MNNKNVTRIIVVCGAVATILGFVLIFNRSTNTIGAILAAFGIIAFVLGIRVMKDNEKETKIKKSGLRFIEDGTLEITNRNPAISNFVKIKTDSDAIVKYESVKLHIGSATVGGVTTGGAYTTGGYNYLAGEKKNGKYKLTAFGETIFRIQLNDEQYLSAKQSEIAKYLNDNRQIQVVNPLQLTAAEAQSVINNLKQSSYLYGGESFKRGFPSYEKCVEIMDWLCGVDKRIEDENIDNE